MLTSDDLSKIKSVIHDEIESVVEDKLAPIKKDLQRIDAQFEPIKKDLQAQDARVDSKFKSIKKDLSYLRKTVSIIARNYDEEDVKLHRRVSKIEKLLALP